MPWRQRKRGRLLVEVDNWLAANRRRVPLKKRKAVWQWNAPTSIRKRGYIGLENHASPPPRRKDSTGIGRVTGRMSTNRQSKL
eukprot:scaffold161838_cov15-Tisochrysis_lutea.AAC.2